ncbi:unnamed protein product [Penicillium olsonii]|nr:unnamed protein product [Penicillium olsonii]
MAGPIFTTTIQEPPGPKLSLPTNPNSNPTVFNDAMKIRMRVFVDEQKCSAEAEIDTDDSRSWHWVLYDGTTAVGTIRLVPPPQGPHGHAVQKGAHEPCIKLTRVAIMPMYRGLGLGRRLVETALEWAAVHAAEVEVQICRGEWRGLVLVHAQVGVEGMYARLGFEVDETLGRWDEEGIEHLGMLKRISVQE